MKGWVVVFALLAACQQSPAPPVAVTPPGKVELVSLNCDTGRNFGLITLTVRNTGPDLGYTKAFINVEGRVMNAPASPAAAGSLVTYDFAIGEARAVSSCDLVAVQDFQGRPLL